MKALLRLLVAFVVLPGAVFGLLWHLDRNGFFALDHIEIVLADSPTQSLYLKPLVDELDRSLETFRGKSLWKIDMSSLSGAIGNLSWVESHGLSRRWPNGLIVTVKPQEVKALYLGKGNKFMPVIREGQVLDAVDAKAAPDVAILDGDAFANRPDLRKKAVQALSEIPPDGTFSRKSISEIRWNAKDGFLMKMTRGGVEVKMGEDQMAIKSARVSQVIEYLRNRGLNAKSLDANLSKKVLVKLEDGQSESLLE